MIQNREHIGGLTPEQDRARLEGADERRARIRALFAPLIDRPIDPSDPHAAEKLAARAAREHRHALETEQLDLADQLDRLLSGENPDDAETLARVKANRARLAALPAELETAADAVALADVRLEPSRLVEHRAAQDVARKALRNLDAEHERLATEYRECERRMIELARTLQDPSFRVKRQELVRRAGLAS